MGALMTGEQVEINSERIDDIPVIVEWLKQMEIAKLIDQKLKLFVTLLFIFSLILPSSSHLLTSFKNRFFH
jgi:hypothetical protein